MPATLDVEELHHLLAALRSASTFEDAATATLSAMLAAASAVLDASELVGRGRMVRAMVHLRPADGYRQLVVLEAGGDRADAVGPSETRLPSTTAWRLVARYGCAAAIDVNLGSIESDTPGVAAEEVTTVLGATETRRRLLDRGTTHVYALPLQRSRGGIDGMIAVEAECRAAIGQPFVWQECGPLLQLLADLAAPYLAALPLRPVASHEHDELLPVIGASMAGLIRLLRVFVQQEETLLLCGATGTGKSRLAGWCHDRSARRKGAFEVLDLSTVPEELQLGELFGWRKGAFTSAVRDHVGAIDRTSGGTLFIDEIDKLSLRAQAGLLQVLETRSYRPLGDAGGVRRCDVRFIVGTNAHLQTAVREQRFREDLYYRINVLPIRLPSLAERSDEIPAWARFMVERRHRERNSDSSVELTTAAEAKLVAYSWPGNLRQLDNVIRRAYAMAIAEHGGTPPQVLRIDDTHLTRALAYENPDRDRSLIELLHAAATAFVREAEHRAAIGTPLDLELANAFPGFVLAAAIEKLESRDDAFRLFGRDLQVKNRNHHKALRRELERVDALCRALGVRPGSFGGDLLDDGEDDG